MQGQKSSFNSGEETTALTPDEKIASLFQPDTLLSDQYFENFRRKTLWQPEKRLMLAVLQDAIHCYQDNLFTRNRKRKKLFLDTEEWISALDRDWVFSFEAVCEALGLNPAYVRQGLLRWQDRRRKQLRPIGIDRMAKLAG